MVTDALALLTASPSPSPSSPSSSSAASPRPTPNAIATVFFFSFFFFSFFFSFLPPSSILVHSKLVSSPSVPQSTVLPSDAATVVGFYDKVCPKAESIVRSVVQKRYLIDRTITPALLRMLFHDAFVRGTDASILLDSKPGHEAEKAALPNLTIRGFDLIDEIKSALEEECPGIVSCADILVLATRDSVALAGGPRFDVPTGRLDGKISVKEEALTLPSPAFPVEQSLESFIEKGLDAEDMVVLLGAHTVGTALCGFFNDRLFNFRGTGAADPAMNATLAARLAARCPNPFFNESDAEPAVALDQATPHAFDAAWFRGIRDGNAVLQIDAELAAAGPAAALVARFAAAGEPAFFPAFARSLVRMANVGVLTRPHPLGEVRASCNRSNNNNHRPHPHPRPHPRRPRPPPPPR